MITTNLTLTNGVTSETPIRVVGITFEVDSKLAVNPSVVFPLDVAIDSSEIIGIDFDETLYTGDYTESITINTLGGRHDIVHSVTIDDISIIPDAPDVEIFSHINEGGDCNVIAILDGYNMSSDGLGASGFSAALRMSADMLPDTQYEVEFDYNVVSGVCQSVNRPYLSTGIVENYEFIGTGKYAFRFRMTALTASLPIYYSGANAYSLDITNITVKEVGLRTVDYSKPYTIKPTLYGLGTNTRGAYGGTVDPIVLHVDDPQIGVFNSDATHGTVSWAMEQTYPRIIVFDIGGELAFEGTTINDPYYWVAGQTAPSPVILTGNTLYIRNGEGLVEHISVRNDVTGDNDAISVVSNVVGQPISNLVISNIGSTWSTDEQLSISEVDSAIFDVTIARSIIGVGFADHNFASLNYLEDATKAIMYAQNLFPHAYMRNPQVSRQTTFFNLNNMVYNWAHSVLQLSHTVDVTDSDIRVYEIGNIAKKGLDTTTADSQNKMINIVDDLALDDNLVSIFMRDSLKIELDGTENYIAGYDINNPGGVAYSTLLEPTPEQTNNYEEIDLYELQDFILNNVGSRPNEREDADVKLMNEVITTTGIHALTQPALVSVVTAIRPFVEVADPHSIFTGVYTNLENQLHTISAQLENTAQSRYFYEG